ncbi:galactosylceramide sulfotransferase-like [Brachionus plicatilis]|uniref:Galactosylceramide sulfotransferase-like n=1 Tax=Brachionus plicatilis TaxID=10195 RepID=A0A3M7Q6G9_BRAPC|nr:galactosylceramide sulfotransferase-like [Brachionus plicatilis]
MEYATRIIIVFLEIRKLEKSVFTNSHLWILQERLAERFESIEDLNIYFVKTHKTAGSSLQNVLIRVADRRKMRVVNNLNIGVDREEKMNNKIFFFHGRHDPKVAEKVFPRNHSLYITILLSFELGYVECGEAYKGSEQSLLERFKNDFDFVFLTEYFNEGLILLKKLLNLSYDDIVCLVLNQGSKEVDPVDRHWAHKIIKNLSDADLIFYDYYLKKYRLLSVLLKDEVNELKKLNQLYQNKCTMGRKEQLFYSMIPYVGFSLRKNLTGELKDFC